MQSIKLPVHTSPGLSTECYHNCRLSIMLAHKAGYPWLWSHFVNLTARSSGPERFPMVRFEDHLDIYAGALQEQPLGKGASWIDSVVEAIDMGEYVIAYLNWKHIPQSNYFGGKDMVHEALVYGYDEASRQIELLAFEVEDRAYSSIRLDYDLFNRELDRVIQHQTQAQQWFAYYGFPVVRVRVIRHAFQTLDARAIYFALDRNNVRSQQHHDLSFAVGCYINEYLAAYFELASNEDGIPRQEYELWNIIMYKMLLHKKWMLQRLQCMQNEWGRGEEVHRIKKYYEKSMQSLRTARGMSLKYQRMDDNSLLASIGEQFQTAFEQERRAVPLLKEHLVRVRLTNA